MKNCVGNLIRCEKLDWMKYIHSLKNQTGSLEKTYWQIWSECHFLTCITCKLQYPVRNSAMCQYHPESPEYFPIGNLGLEQPIGIMNNILLTITSINCYKQLLYIFQNVSMCISAYTY